MNKTEKINLLEDFKVFYETKRKNEDNLESLIPGFFASPYSESVYDLVDFMTKSVATVLGCEEDVLFWHIHDNEWGKRGHRCFSSEFPEGYVISDSTTFVEYECNMNSKV